MKSAHFLSYSRLSVVVFLSMLLTVFPLTTSFDYFRPMFLLLIALYGAIFHPEQCGVVFAWALGLVADMLTGATLGQHALAFVVVSYVAQKGHHFLRHLFVWQQLLFIFVLSLVCLLIQRMVFYSINEPVLGWRFWLPAIGNLFAWPILYFVMRQGLYRQSPVIS